jgi:hypothetical protein
MPAGFNQPTSASASRATNTGLQPSTVRTRQGRFEAPAQTPGPGEPPSSRRKSTIPPALTIPQQSGDSQPPSAGRKSPAYLQGKNPYGQVLDKIEHPYREPRAAPTADGPPSQADSSIEGRRRMLGSLEFQTRPRPQEPEPESSAPTSGPRPQPPPGRRLMSVRTAKNFFDTKASHNPSAPLLPPPEIAGSKRGAAPKRQPPSPSRDRPVRAPSPKKPRTPSPEPAPAPTAETEPADTGLLLSRLTGSDPIDLALSVIPFVQTSADQTTSNVGEADFPTPDVGEEVQHPPNLVVRRATPPIDVTLPVQESSGTAFERGSAGRRRSTNIFDNAPRDAKPLGFERRAVDDSSTLDATSNAPLIAVEESKSTDQRGTSEETVRRPSPHSPMPPAETQEAEAPRHLEPQQETRRAKSGRDIRRAFEEDKDSVPKRLQRRGSRSTPVTEDNSPRGGRTTNRRFSKTSSTDFDLFRSRFGKPVDVRKRAEEIVSRGLSHDGSSSPPPSRRTTIPSPISTANLGIDDIKVPDDLEDRQGFGRRITQDFGFPGARIKSGPPRTKRPLQDPGHWVKRACGHFSYMGKDEHRDHAHERRCRQCSAQAPPQKSQPSHPQRARKRAASESTSSSSSSSKRRRRQHRSACLSPDKCGDTLAKDLGHIIDSILEEHTNTLNSVIHNIQHSQPGLRQLQRVSDDLVKLTRPSCEAAEG